MTARWESLDADRQEAYRSLVVDALGLAAAGAANEDAGRVLDGLASLGAGEVPVPWTDLRLAAPQAASAFSTLVHAWDFDDTHDEAVVHTATVVLPAAYVAALTAGTGGRALLDGVVTGVQVLSRLSGLVGPRTGVIRTAGLGSLAAAATAATVWGADDAGVANAMALAVGPALAPTTRQAVVDGSVAKRLQPGLMAAYGVTAAGLARAGVVGPAGWLTGTYGLVPGAELAYAGLLGGTPEIDVVALKPYPACRYTHAAVAAAEQLHARRPDPGTVERVVVHVPAGDSYRLVSRAYEDRGAPLVDAQFSIPWQVAALWCTGAYDLTTLTDHLGDPAIAAWAARVQVHQDLPEASAMSGARVEVHTTDGAVETAEAAMPGAGEHRLDRVTLGRKLRACLTVGGHADPERRTSDLWALADELPALDPAGLADAMHRLQPVRLAQPA